MRWHSYGDSGKNAVLDEFYRCQSLDVIDCGLRFDGTFAFTSTISILPVRGKVRSLGTGQLPYPWQRRSFARPTDTAKLYRKKWMNANAGCTKCTFFRPQRPSHSGRSRVMSKSQVTAHVRLDSTKSMDGSLKHSPDSLPSEPGSTFRDTDFPRSCSVAAECVSTREASRIRPDLVLTLGLRFHALHSESARLSNRELFRVFRHSPQKTFCTAQL